MIVTQSLQHLLCYRILCALFFTTALKFNSHQPRNTQSFETFTRAAHISRPQSESKKEKKKTIHPIAHRYFDLGSLLVMSDEKNCFFCFVLQFKANYCVTVR